MKTVILAAGFGSRLWPLSTSERPKQFLRLVNNQSLLFYTYDQLSKITSPDELFVLTLAGLEEQVRAELPNIDPAHILLVPERRNTLPHTLWALNSISKTTDEPILFKSVDQFALDPDAFIESLGKCIERYDHSKKTLTLLCSSYESFNSNDGYCIVDRSGAISKFLEKPNQEELESYASSNRIYRNPMLYITTAQAFLGMLDVTTQDWCQPAKKLLLADPSAKSQALLDMPFMDMSHAYLSFLEAHKLAVDEIVYAFTDIGRFEEVYDLNDKDPQGNVLLGDVILGAECHNSLIMNETPAPLVVLSADSSVIVQTLDGSLVSPLREASKIGEIYKSQIHGR